MLRRPGKLIFGCALLAFLLQSRCDRPQPPQLDTLHVGLSTDVDHWSLERFPDGDSRFVWAQVFETLVRLTPDLRTVPGLAKSWETDPDARIWTFRLRPNVTFHDGRPLTSETVAAAYHENTFARRTVLRPIEQIETPETLVVRFRLARPMPLPLYLTHVAWPVALPATEPDAPGELVGTGPYRLVEQLREQQVLLERNPEYWGRVPDIERVDFRIIPDPGARVIALEAGEIDLAVKLPESDIARLAEVAGLRVHRTLSTFTDFLQFNARRPPFDDLQVRQAVAHAIETAALVNGPLAGVGRSAEGRPLSPVLLYADEPLPAIEHDPAAARRLLADAGWQDADGDGVAERNGEPLRVVLLVSQNANVAVGTRFLLLAEAVQHALREVGFDVAVRQLEAGAFLQAENDGEFGVLLRTGFYVWGNYPRHFFLHTSQNPYSHFRNDAYDELVQAADATVDPDRQRALYGELQRETMRLLPAFYLVHQEKIVVTGPRVSEYEISAEAPWLNLVSVRPQRGGG